MKLTQRQAQAINDIIQEEVQDALKGRSQVAEHLRRGKLFEEVGSYEAEEARAKAEEAAALLSEARALLEGDPRLHKVAEEAFESAYTLMSMLDDEMTAGDEIEEPGRSDFGAERFEDEAGRHERG